MSPLKEMWTSQGSRRSLKISQLDNNNTGDIKLITLDNLP